MAISNTGIEYAAPLPWQLPVWQRLSEQFDRRQLAHAYLFYGDEGLAKSLFVNAFANFLLCQDKSAKVACGSCANCRQGGGVNYHPDILHVAPEDGSRDIKIDQVRALSEFAVRTAHTAAAKIIIIHQAHRLNPSAANALLKTLEEPSADTYLFLISDLPGNLVATIRSRCQKLNLPSPTREQASEWLQGILGSSADINELLNASANNPIHALRLADGDQLQSKQQFLSSLGDLALGKVSIQFVLGLSAKIGELDVLRYLAESSSTVVKYLLSHAATEPGPSEAATSMQSLYGTFTLPGIDVNSVAERLLVFYSEVELARRQLTGSTNPNPQLIMESLFWRWSKIIRTH